MKYWNFYDDKNEIKNNLWNMHANWYRLLIDATY